MRRRLRRRLRALRGEEGLTLIELLVASTMSVVLVGAASAMLISAVHDQPALSRKSQNVTTARYQLERVVRELRNGVKVVSATPSQVSFVARVRREENGCGGPVPTDPEADTIECEITYSCAEGKCMRSEGPVEGEPVGTPTAAFTGVGNENGKVFCFMPTSSTEPNLCGETEEPEDTTYVGVTLEVPNPDGPGLLTISDGATLRAAVYTREASG